MPAQRASRNAGRPSPCPRSEMCWARIHPLLPRHHPRHLHRSADHRRSADQGGIPLPLRRRRDRHRAGSRAVCRFPAQPGYTWLRRSEPIAAQCYWVGCRRCRRRRSGALDGICDGNSQVVQPVSGEDGCDRLCRGAADQLLDGMRASGCSPINVAKSQPGRNRIAHEPG